MNKLFVSWVVLLLGIIAPCKKVKAQDPITLIIKEGVTKVIKAVDLRIQRLQNKTIWLQNAQKTLENTLSKVKLQEISSWVEKQKVLYGDYYEELWKVKAVLSYYYRIKDITDQQLQLVAAYKQAFALLKQDRHFTIEELAYMGRVYTGILEESLKCLDGLFLVINSFATQMSDAKRLALIEEVAHDMQQHKNALQQFTNQNIQLSLQRARDEKDVTIVKALYGLK
jgi:predicted transcriptional regulator YheO